MRKVSTFFSDLNQKDIVYSKKNRVLCTINLITQTLCTVK